MRVILQRVTDASVTVKDKIKGAINQGILVLVGIENEDSQEDIKWLSKKIINMRIFDDSDGTMNKSIIEVNGDLLVISQFTLHASIKKGNRPSYIKAAKPDIAVPLYENFLSQLKLDLNKPIQSGVFGADMKISLTNDGPVTILIDTKNKN